MSSFCDAVQEELAWGRALTEAAAAHSRSCGRCAALATQLAAVDAVYASDDDLGARVPEGFADRVMARLPAIKTSPQARDGIASKFVRMTERRWVQIVLVHAGVALTVTNLIRFAISLLVPATSLGGGR